MRASSKVRILSIILLALALGLGTTLITDLHAQTTTSPTNVIYSGDNVLYYHFPLLSVTQSKKRGFPFISQSKVITKYTNEEIPGPSTTVQLPSVSSRGSNSFSQILRTWQFYADVATWTIVWLGITVALV